MDSTDSFVTPAYLAPPLAAFCLSLVLVAIVLVGSGRNRAHKLLALLILSTGLWALFIFLMRWSPDTSQALFWNKLAVSFSFFTPAFYYHFTRVYTGRHQSGFWLIIAYMLPAISFLLMPTGLIVQGMSVQYFGYSPVFGPTMYVLLVIVYAVLALGFRNLVLAYRSSTSYEERNRLVYLVLAISFPMIGGIFELFPSAYPATIFGNLMFGGATAIAILKYRLLDIQLILRRGTAYLLMSVMVALPYAGIIILSTQMLGTTRTIWVHLALLLVLAVALLPLWGRVRHMVDKAFYRDRYDYLKALEEFNQKAHDIRDFHDLATSLVRQIRPAVKAAVVYILLPGPDGDFRPIVSSRAGVGASKLAQTVHLEREAPPPVLAGDGLLVKWLRHSDVALDAGNLDIQPHLQSISARDRSELERTMARLLIPLKMKNKELAGILLLGEKLSGQPYSQEDQTLLHTVASRMAVELENARLYFLERTMRRELEEQDQRKTEFLHSVAHELKTPLTAVISSSELMGNDYDALGPDQKAALINNISTSAWKMNKRITELLDFARVQRGMLFLDVQRLDCVSLVQDVVSQLGILFTGKDQTLMVDMPDELPWLNGDRAKLEQVLTNLLENANKFSAHGGHIRFRASQLNDKVLMEVEDSAPPIAEEERLKIFDPYYRGEDADRRQRLPGLGLGLALVKEIVKLHGGEVWVTVRPGSGNIFMVSLPVPGTQVTRDIEDLDLVLRGYD